MALEVIRFVRVASLLAALGLIAATARAQAAAPDARDALHQLNASVESLASTVSKSVVQVQVTGFGPLEDSGRRDADVVLGQQRSLGSGVIVDTAGYIVTNAHVVAGAQRVQVVLPTAAVNGVPRGPLTVARGRTVEARIVGVAREVDLAVLKIDVVGLTGLRLANYDAVRQGQLVFAFGSPQGLRNSVSMGVVSAVARQAEPDSPLVYVQTDAPINPGNSGGALVNIDGELVGINTFIVTESGGSQGLGFAIPSALVAVVYPQLVKYGHLHRGEIGIDVQTITANMTEGLRLPIREGIIVSDVAPFSPAFAAGVRVQDIITSVDGRAMDSVPMFGFLMQGRTEGDRLKLGVLRGSQSLTLDVPVVVRQHETERLPAQVDPQRSLIAPLGVLGVAINRDVAQALPGLRIPSGIIVAGRTPDPRGNGVSLATGDVIHAINGLSVDSLDGLRAFLDSLTPHSSVVLQIERDGRLLWVSFQSE